MIVAIYDIFAVCLCLCTRTTTRKWFSQYYVVRARVWIGVIFGGKHDSRSLFLRWVETVVEAFKLSNVNIFITLQSGESLSAINKKIIIALTFLLKKCKKGVPLFTFSLATDKWQMILN